MPPTKVILRLYIIGGKALSNKAIADVEKLLSEDSIGKCHLEIVDILLNPKEAEKHNIIATPTLIKAQPKPEKRIVGDLSNKERLLSSLDLEEPKPGSKQGGEDAK
jgi:circadian clock protein KaiB